MSPASSHPSLPHNGSTTDISNISLSVPDGDLQTDGTAKFPVVAIPPKKPLTPYMKFSKSVSTCALMRKALDAVFFGITFIIRSIQKRAIRIMHQVTRHMPYDNLLYHSNIASLQDRRSQQAKNFSH